MSDKKPLASELGTDEPKVKNGVDPYSPQLEDMTGGPSGNARAFLDKEAEKVYEEISSASHDLVQSSPGDPAKWGS